MIVLSKCVCVCAVNGGSTAGNGDLTAASRAVALRYNRIWMCANRFWNPFEFRRGHALVTTWDYLFLLTLLILHDLTWFGAGHLRGSRLLSFFHSSMKITLCGGGGVGWGGKIMSFALPHICDATYLYALLHFIIIHTYVMLRCRFSCASTHMSCYAVDSLALPHMRHATLRRIILHFHAYVMLRCGRFLLHFRTYVMLRCCRFSCTSTHASCYVAVDYLALPHIRHATLL